jgi:hypothetical protein
MIVGLFKVELGGSLRYYIRSIKLVVIRVCLWRKALTYEHKDIELWV